MKVLETVPPREFQVGYERHISLRDCGQVWLEPDEQVTFRTENNAEYDVVRKSWGYYATPSTNGRLAQFGLRTCIVCNRAGRRFVLLVEAARLEEFERYIKEEQSTVECWLDGDLPLYSSAASKADLHCPCGSTSHERIHVYHEPPAGEVRFAASSERIYRRELYQCRHCRHVLSVDDMDHDTLYTGDYVSSTYGDLEGVKRTFDRINALPPDQSDNMGRVRSVLDFARHFFADDHKAPSILDIGSGLCVFLYRMQQAGWCCTALDPDSRSARHALENVGVEAVCTDFMQWSSEATFDAISLNKVLEHVKSPLAMLERTRRHLRAGGFVYVELPDAEGAMTEGFGREEFFIDHYHVFSAASLALLAERAGFDVMLLQRLREPSTKFTLRAFLTAKTT
jgi:SAM-dependent methyltransferase